ncbi:substrate-binding periplasmic protein [Colwellia sp. 12G3]|uniref:substrate-binding periplasmic protein n=1 Tax=Colwellia sp. 12G3 TaxID=2058299 RepID=UPI000C3438E0|nr:transporter substrate-binding domain-containing protein [Colwellia sp. 12G3]PKI15872.1 cation transporter [Colwellia sp. 12G3]
MIKLTTKLRLWSFTFPLLWLSVSIAQVQAKTLVVASDEWCPYICDDRTLPGFLVEIVKEIAANNTIKVKLSLMPLARALDLAQKGKVDILLALTPQHIAEFQLQQSQTSFGGLYNDFYVHADQPWRFKNIDDLATKLKDNAILGTINGYQYGTDLGHLIEENTSHIFSASGISPLQKQLDMLQMKRLDILLDSRFTVQFHLAKLPNYTIVYAGTQGDFTPLFLGFSSLFDKALIPVFDEGLQALRESGRLKQILAKYDVNDWQQQSQMDTIHLPPKSQ